MARVGPCAPWINSDDVRGRITVTDAIDKALSGKANAPTLSPEAINAILAQGAAAATDVLYQVSGRVFTGRCGPVTIRPEARPVGMDRRNWSAMGGAWGYSGTWGVCNYWGGQGGNIVSHFGCSNPPVIDFDVYPINEIVEVKIDGVVIPSDEYELRDHRELVRMRPTPSFVPTERWGWPTCQVQDLPDTQPGTFSVTYTYGQDPGDGGRLAAAALAEVLVLPSFGDNTRTPVNMTSFNRQGISGVVASMVNILKDGAFHIPEIDVWLFAVNPQGQRRQSSVWSPDLGRQRRTARPSA